MPPPDFGANRLGPRNLANTAMDFALTDDQHAIDEGIRRITARFGDDYWLAPRPRRRVSACVPAKPSPAAAGSASRCRWSTAGADSD